MQPGTRVIFWEDAGRMKHGCVQAVGFVDVRFSPCYSYVPFYLLYTLRGLKLPLLLLMVIQDRQ